MCESSVFLERDGSRELIMEEAVEVVAEGSNVRVIGLLGERREVRGRIKEVNLTKHQIVIAAE
ncbi:MAG: CooT family nickel-binding protein [Candidatus Alkanophagales archaeon]